jgi:hypothetical protein
LQIQQRTYCHQVWAREIYPSLSACRSSAHLSQGVLASAEDAARAARQREDAARAQGREYADRARRAETLCEEAEAELAQVRRFDFV